MKKDTFRLKILKRLTERLETITILNGYQHDLADAVFRGRDHFGEEQGDPIPMISIFEQGNLDDFGKPAAFSGIANTEITVIIQGFVTEDPNNPLDPAYHLLGDLQIALTSIMLQVDDQKRRNILSMGNKLISFDVGKGSVAPPKTDVSKYSFCFIPIKISFIENRSMPFE